MTDPERGGENAYGCVVYDLLNVADIFGMLGDIVNMVRMGHFWPTDEWQKRVWKRAWVLDEYFLEATGYGCHSSLNLLYDIGGSTKYLIWWQISNPELMKCCEIVLMLISHASLLKNDDVRLKSLPI